MEGDCAMDVTPLRRRAQRYRLALVVLGVAVSMAATGCGRQTSAVAEHSAAGPSSLGAVADGCAGIGGKAPPPWRMLTEDEARAVIGDELGRAGLKVRMDARSLRDLHVPVIDGSHICYELDSPTNRSLRDRKVELSRRLADAVGPRAWGTPPVELSDAIATRLVERLRGGLTTQSPEVAAIADEAIAAAQAVDGTKRENGTTIHALTERPEAAALHAFPGGTWLARTADITLDGASDDPAVAFEYLLGPRGVTTNVPSPRELSRDPDGIELGACQDVPESLRLALDLAEPGVRHAVFHDPGRASLESAQDDLRAQVSDFIEWLKAEGVL
jgi:hypothetical protein